MTLWGVSFFAYLDYPSDPENGWISRLGQLPVSTTRTTRFLKTASAFSIEHAALTSRGYKLLINIANVAAPTPPNSPGASAPLTSGPETTTYKNDLDAMLTAVGTSNIAACVIENEQTFSGNFSGTATQYGAMMVAAMDVCHPRGVKVASGGYISSSNVRPMTYQILRSESNPTLASAFWDMTGGGTEPTYPPPGTWDDFLEQDRDVRDATGLPIDFSNCHFYGPHFSVPQALDIAIGAIGRYTGRPVISNESNFNSSLGAIWTPCFQVVKDNALAYFQVQSISTGAVDLFDGSGVLKFVNDGTLYGPGEAYRDFISPSDTSSVGRLALAGARRMPRV